MAKNNENKMLFISTNGYDKYTVNTFFTLCRHTGFNPVFSSFYQLDEHTLDSYKTIIISFDSLFIGALADKIVNNQKTESPLLIKGKNIISALAKLKEKMIVLLLPATNNQKLQEFFLDFCLNKQLIAHLDQKTINSFKNSVTSFLMKPDSERSFVYDTALLTKNPTAKKTVFKIEPTNNIKVIPQPTDDPLGILLQDNQRSNSYCVSKNSLLLCAEINENFVYMPQQFQERQKKIKNIMTFLNDIQNITAQKTSYKTMLFNRSLPSPFNERMIYRLQQNNRNIQSKIFSLFPDKKIWLGWTELRTYKNQESNAAANILKSGLNSIWIELVPEWYFGVHAAKKDKKLEFMQDLTGFINVLKQEAAKLNKPMPRIFAGTNITSNFYKSFNNQLPSTQQTVDAYGTVYSKIPAPLDRQFWYEEVIDPLQKFIKEWQQQLPSVPLGGIFFDFEMYLNDQTGEYENLMDFSDNTWSIYAEKSNQPLLKKIGEVNQRIGFLVNNNKMEEYQQILLQDAYAIGTWIKQSIKNLLPNALLGAYAINLPYKWFYLGMLGGLSDKLNPIILATFNNEFYPHLTWLTLHNIYAVHLPVCMLSKLREESDKALIEQLAKHNDGVWFNRISHWEESKNPKQWPWDFGTEVSPLSTEQCINIIGQVIKKF